MDLTNNKIFQLGVKIGRKMVMDHIQHQCSIDKPIEANGELYWLKDSRQNLQDIMDDIETAYEDQKGKKYIVPMQRVVDGKCIEFEVIVSVDTGYEAWCVAISNFEKDGWYVFPRYGEYKEFKG